MSSPAPKSPEMTDKSRKYDRQIRLWGEHGQALLENANVCLINATVLGAEILKGVILPGIGGYTIVDGNVVTEEDIGCNFFLETTSLGQSRSKCCAQLLQELNPDVNGDYIDENIDQVLINNPDFFKTFDIVLATSLMERTIIKLSQKLWSLNIPFILCRSVGLMATVRLQIKEHCIIETHPDNQHSDLRLERPFTSLKEHLDSAELTAKVPWLLVLYKYLQKWSESNNNKPIPTTYKEKNDLRELIRNGMTADEENYEEAIKAVNSSFHGGKADSTVRRILDDPLCINLNKQSKPFWIMAKAVRDFEAAEGNGWLPLPGILPDMTADTASFINLQNVYRAQAMQDSDIVYRRTQEILKELDIPSDSITQNDVKLFCREAAHIGIVRGTKISDEYEKTYKTATIASGLEEPNSLMGHYVALRAMEKFQIEHGCIPGEYQIETDIARLKTLAMKLLNEWGINNPLTDELIHEICRYGGAEIHSVSAFMGGCVAHELIKIITKQYKPINNTVVYDAITSKTETFEL